MKYLDKDSEIVLQAVNDIENISFLAYPDYIHTVTKGKYMKNNDLFRILLSLCNSQYLLTISNPINGLQYYITTQDGKAYVNTKTKFRLHEMSDWIKVFGGSIIGAILGAIITTVLSK